MNILRCCTGFLSGLFATRPDGQSGRRGFVIGVMIGAMLMVGAPGWLPQGGVIPAAQAKPPTPTIDVPLGWHGVHDEIELVDVVGDPLDFPDIFSRTPISVGTHDGWWLLATGNIGPFTLPMPDLDQDGVVEIGQAWDRIDHHELQIWLTSVGPRGTRQPDIVIAERFNTHTHAFSRIGAAEDVDGDGVREITTLGVATNRSNNQGVPILSVYRSTTGRPSLTLFGSDADILMAVLEGRATGHRADNLLSVIRDSDPLVANFSAERSRSGLAQALGIVVATESIQYDPWVMDGMAISPLVFQLADQDPGVWSGEIARALYLGAHDADSPRLNLFSRPEEMSALIASVVGSNPNMVGPAIILTGTLQPGVNSAPFSHIQMDGAGNPEGIVPGGTAIIHKIQESPMLNAALEEAKRQHSERTGGGPVNLRVTLAAITLAGVGGMSTAPMFLATIPSGETVAYPMANAWFDQDKQTPGMRKWLIRTGVGLNIVNIAITLMGQFGVTPGQLMTRGQMARCGGPLPLPWSTIKCAAPCVAAAKSNYESCLCRARVAYDAASYNCAIQLMTAMIACVVTLLPGIGLAAGIWCFVGIALVISCAIAAKEALDDAVAECKAAHDREMESCGCIKEAVLTRP